jgi:putative endopeptidase
MVLERCLLTRWLACLVVLASPVVSADDAELLEIVESAAVANDAPRGTANQLLGDFYRAFIDEAQVENQGLAPIAGDLAEIAALRTPADVARHIGLAQRRGVPGPLEVRVAPDPQVATRYAAMLGQGGLTLPGRNDYLSPEDGHAAQRAELLRYIEQLLARGGHADAASAARRVEALETRLANYHETHASNSALLHPFANDATRGRLNLAQLQALAPGIDWYQFFAGAAVAPSDVYVAQPTFVFGLGLLVKTVPISDWRAYFTFRLLDHYAPYLPPQFSDLHAAFHARLPGARPPLPRSLRALREIERSLGPVLSAEYAATRFSAEKRANAERLAQDVVLACESGVQQATWLSEATRDRLRARLANLAWQVGSPAMTNDYAALVVSETDLIGNLRRAAEFEFSRRARRIGMPIDANAWEVPTYSAQVHYRAELHELIVPAGALDLLTLSGPAAAAQNYSGNGVVIARAVFAALAVDEQALAPLEANFVATLHQAARAATLPAPLEGRRVAPK